MIPNGSEHEKVAQSDSLGHPVKYFIFPQVYPLFVDLSTLWTGFQDEMVLLSVLSNVLTSLQPFSQSHKQLFPPEVLGGSYFMSCNIS